MVQAWRKVVAAYRRVGDLRSPAADCLYTGISSGPNARYRVWEAFTFTFYTKYIFASKLKIKSLDEFFSATIF